MRNLHFVLILLAMVSCKRAEDIQQENLYGKWDIVRAERNGEMTTYLNGGYFVIEEEGMMTVNITGEDERGPFIIERNHLELNDKIFEIESLSNDSLVIRHIASSNGRFKIYMARNKEDVQ
jgi:hypothetical protein